MELKKVGGHEPHPVVYSTIDYSEASSPHQHSFRGTLVLGEETDRGSMYKLGPYSM